MANQHAQRRLTALADAGYRKSSYSGGDSNSNCVEQAAADGVVGIRDTKDRDGGTLVLPPAAWTGFIAGVKAGEFGRP